MLKEIETLLNHSKLIFMPLKNRSNYISKVCEAHNRKYLVFFFDILRIFLLKFESVFYI